jgi:MFS family permease
MTTSTGEAQSRLYTRRFFQVFVAAGVFMAGISLQFHFGQYVGFLGHGVDRLGLILSAGMIGTLCFRLQIGRWIDRFGCRPTWLVGASIVAVSVGCIQFTSHLWLIACLRAVSSIAAAAVMTTVAVFAADFAPPRRKAESIGTIGLAGFVGLMMGPTIGDWVFASAGESFTPYHVFFSLSAAFSLVSALCIWFVGPSGLTSENEPAAQLFGGADKSGTTASAPKRVSLIVAYWPGVILLVAASFGFVFCFHSSFLERLAEYREFADIKLFFLTYCPTAIALRLVFRRLPQQLGRSRTVLLGLLSLIVGLVCLLDVQTQVDLVLPGFFLGTGHCFVFPSMVDLAADRFPAGNRGTATALVLGAGDLGMLIGYLALGMIIENGGFGIAIWTIVGVVAVATVCFVSTKWMAIAGRRSSRTPSPGSGTTSCQRA